MNSVSAETLANRVVRQKCVAAIRYMFIGEDEDDVTFATRALELS